MCSTPKAAKLPSVPASPPPPEETAQDFSTVRDEEEKTATAKKRRGTRGLKIQDKSPLSIPAGPSSGLNIP